MKRKLQIIGGSILFVALLTVAWSYLYPMLFPGQTKAANDAYQSWLQQNQTSTK